MRRTGVAGVVSAAVCLMLLMPSAASATSPVIREVKHVDGAPGLALSAEGTTALIGGSKGAAWVLTRSGGKWPQMGEPTFGFGEGRSEHVGLSSDGKTALIGGSNAGPESGIAVFARSGSTWTLRFARKARYVEGTFVFGRSVALSGDGETALVGQPFGGGPAEEGSGFGPGGGRGEGAAWVFVRKGSTWTQQGGALISNTEPSAVFGESSMALSADGNTALIGGRNAAWVFKRKGSAWAQQGPKLTGAEEVCNPEAGSCEFGGSVALSSHGNTALIGNPCDGSLPYEYDCHGAAWVFVRKGSTWTQQGPKLTGAGEVNERAGCPYPRCGGIRGGHFGSSVALSGRGNTALIGGPEDNTDAGAAWVFKRRGSTWTQQGSKLTCSAGGILTHVGEPESCGGSGAQVALSSDADTAFISEGATSPPETFCGLRGTGC